MTQYNPERDDHDIALAVKYETKPIWADIEDIFGVGPTGAAIVVAAFEAFFTGRPVSYSRRKMFYGPSRHRLLTYRKVTTSVDRLGAAGWLQHYKQAPGYRGWQSAFEATPELVEAVLAIMQDKPNLKLARLHNTTILRDADGKPMVYRPTRAIQRQDKKTDGFNECITAARIEHGAGSNVVELAGLACPMARIYNQTFDRGGRFYAMGASWQNVESKKRRDLTIDGEAVCELDFKTIHPALLYQEAGATMPSDCYAIGSWPRDLVKQALLTLINADSAKKAQGSIAHSDGTPKRPGDEPKELMQMIAEPGSRHAMKVAGQIISDIKKAHRAIEEHFHTGAGARLMRKDSDIAAAVMAEMMMRKGVVALPVHDSFVCPASKASELESAMLGAAEKAGLPELRVEAK